MIQIVGEIKTKSKVTKGGSFTKELGYWQLSSLNFVGKVVDVKENQISFNDFDSKSSVEQKPISISQWH